MMSNKNPWDITKRPHTRTKLEIIQKVWEKGEIVAYLDNLRKKVEKLKQLQQKQSEDLTELEQSILHHSFARKL